MGRRLVPPLLVVLLLAMALYCFMKKVSGRKRLRIASQLQVITNHYQRCD